jgi:RecA/RadA recombinase
MELDAMLYDIEVDIGLSQVDIKSNKITTSTGLLSLDLMLSGGMVTGGWYTMFGGEQSCKSTLVMTQMARAVDMPIPYILYFEPSSTNSMYQTCH